MFQTTPLHTIHRDYSIMNVKWINTVSFLSWGLSSAIESHKINMDHIMTVLSNAFEINKNITAVAYSLKR